MAANQQSCDVAVIGAGIIGAACALACARTGLSVVVFDRGGPVAGTTGAGEGNILVSDKLPGPELDLALLSNRLWRAAATELGDIELAAKGGLMTAGSDRGRAALEDLAVAQAARGVEIERVGPDELRTYEPYIAPDLAGGLYYPQDLQVQPARAAAAMLAAAQSRGAIVRYREPVVGIDVAGGAVAAVRTDHARVGAGTVINAAGVWAGEVGALAGVAVAIVPRRGFILVTEPVPDLVTHKVYLAGYLDSIASDAASLQAAAVVESTAAGPILIGATRELAGFASEISLPAIRLLARGAVDLFPVLASVRVVRAYRGFRPFSPDHLPVIGPDPLVSGLVHAYGHEGAGIGLAPATGLVVAEIVTGDVPSIDVRPFDPARFDAAT